MVELNVCDSYSFILLFLLIARAVAGNTADFIRKQDIFVNHGLRNVTTASDIQCCVTCMFDDICDSVSYNDANRICQVNAKDPNKDDTARTTSIVGWTSFHGRPCRSGWYFYTGSCYKVVTVRQNWTSSESNCQTLGGHLVDINNADEDRFVQELAANASENSWYWIGLSDRTEEGTFVWSSSAPNQFQEPVSGNKADRDCAEIYPPSYSNWFIHQCQDNDNSVCKANK